MQKTFKANLSGKSVYKCQSCGKMTRETGNGEQGTGNCAFCFEEGGLENSLQDGHITQEEFDDALDQLQKQYKRGKYAASPTTEKTMSKNSRRKAALAPSTEVAAEQAAEATALNEQAAAGAAEESKTDETTTTEELLPAKVGESPSDLVLRTLDQVLMEFDTAIAKVVEGDVTIALMLDTAKVSATFLRAYRSMTEAVAAAIPVPTNGLTPLQQAAYDAIPSGREYSCVKIAKEAVFEDTQLDREQARRTLKTLVAKGLLEKVGTSYRRPAAA